jgi:glutamyl-tRNA reductase
VGVLACGFNHREMALAEREQWSLVPESWPAHLAVAKSSPLEEAVIVSTCNRTELYAVAESRQSVEHYFQQLYHSVSEPIAHRLYWHESEEAVRHLMRVSSGLDSMCLGEPQIFGQVKLAYQTACEAGTVGSYFKTLFPAAFSASKQVRSETGLGIGAVTLAYAVCQLVRQLYKAQKKRQVLCVGAGETIESMLSHLSSQDALDICVVNRSPEKAKALAENYQVNTVCWEQLPSALMKADIVITATSSEEPVITTQQVKEVCQNRESKEPLFFADLAVPRDIEATVADLPSVFLYNLDDMQQVLEKNQSHRMFAAGQAQTIIDRESVRFMERNKISESANVIKEFRSYAEDLRDQCLDRALNQLQTGSDAESVMRRFASDLTNKLLHQPTVSLREIISKNESNLSSIFQKLLSDQKNKPIYDE